MFTHDMHDPRKKQARRYHRIRSRLVARGLTLNRWAVENGYRPTTVYAAARGVRTGALSEQIVQELEALNA